MKQGSLKLVLESVNPSDQDFEVAQEILGILFPSDLDSLRFLDEQKLRKAHHRRVYWDSGLPAA